MGVLDEIKAISAQLGLGFGLKLAICFKCLHDSKKHQAQGQDHSTDGEGLP